jgi:hypothetical protein
MAEVTKGGFVVSAFSSTAVKREVINVYQRSNRGDFVASLSD